jgi:TPR repeat protein
LVDEELTIATAIASRRGAEVVEPSMRKVVAFVAAIAALLAAASLRANPGGVQDGGRELRGFGLPEIDLQSKYDSLRYALVLIAGIVEYRRGLDALNERRMEEALDRLNGAAACFNANAKLRLARMYRTGDGVAVDREEALLWYLQLADSGYAVAQFELAAMLESEAKGPNDRAGALHWYRAAASGGDALARRRLALLDRDGDWIGRETPAAPR